MTERRRSVIVLSGAGISAESGISTFRDADGLWENHRIEDVATPGAWHKDRELVLEFYNQRRRNVLEVEPNPGHLALVELESKFDVHIVTQNVDDLHERAGSSNVVHLHGEIRKSRSTLDPNLVYEIEGPELNLGDTCEKGSQLRPHIVWFGEMVPMLGVGANLVATADILLVVGTSLNVYPAAGLIHEAPNHCETYVVDPGQPELSGVKNVAVIKEKAGTALPRLCQDLLEDAQ